MGDGWLHEIKYDSDRMHASIDSSQVKLLTCTGLDWSKDRRPLWEETPSFAVQQASAGDGCGIRGAAGRPFIEC